MSVDDLMGLLEAHPSVALVVAIVEPPATGTFLPIAVKPENGAEVAKVLLVLRPAQDMPLNDRGTA